MLSEMFHSVKVQERGWRGRVKIDIGESISWLGSVSTKASYLVDISSPLLHS